MSFCRSASELISIGDLKLSGKALSLVDDLTPGELILGVRNRTISDYIMSIEGYYEYDDSDEVWMKYYDELRALTEEIKRAVTVEGFIRNDLMDLLMPESYFVKEYVQNLKLADYRKCMPFYFSNETYERYQFTYERLVKIFQVLQAELTPKQYRIVKNDIMYLDGYLYPGNNTLKEAKLKLSHHRKKIGKRLEKIWQEESF